MKSHRTIEPAILQIYEIDHKIDVLLLFFPRK